MKKPLLLSLIAASILIISSCTNCRPEYTLRQFLDSIKHHEYEKAKSLLTIRSRQFVSKIENLASLDNTTLEDLDIPDHFKYQITASEIRGNEAVCQVVINQNEPIEIWVKKEEGKWRVDLPIEILQPLIGEQLGTFFEGLDALFTGLGELGNGLHEMGSRINQLFDDFLEE